MIKKAENSRKRQEKIKQIAKYCKSMGHFDTKPQLYRVIKLIPQKNLASNTKLCTMGVSMEDKKALSRS